MASQYSLLHIDDLGSSEPSDLRIIPLLRKHPEISVSVLIKAENIDYLNSKLLPQLNELNNSIYVHLNLVEGILPFTHTENKRNSIGRLLIENFRRYIFLLNKNRKLCEKYVDECVKQIEFITSRLSENKPIGFDSHMNVHLLRNFDLEILAIANQYPNLKIRVIREDFNLATFREIGLRYLTNFMKYQLVKTGSEKIITKLPKQYVAFRGISCGEALNEKILKIYLQNNTTKIYLHPNYDPKVEGLKSRNRFQKFYASPQRLKELDAIVGLENPDE